MTGHEDDGLVAVVTGAGRGIGAASAERLLRRGYRVVLVARDAERLAAIAAPHGDRAHAHPADLASADACEQAIAVTVARWGRVDVLVNNAAVLGREPLDEVTRTSLERLFAVNFGAVLWLCRAAMADMETRGWGRIVNLTSVGVHTGGYSLSSAAYEASKAAVANLTKTLARHGAPRGILVNAVAPGATRTRMLTGETPAPVLAALEADTPLGRLAEPDEIAAAVEFLASSGNTYASGATFDVNGALAMP